MESLNGSRVSEIDLRKPKSGLQGLNMRAARSVFKLQPLEREIKQMPNFITNQPYQDYILEGSAASARKVKKHLEMLHMIQERVRETHNNPQ